MINSIVLSNVGPFVDRHELPLHPRLTVVVGHNNTGKSTLLRSVNEVTGREPKATHLSPAAQNFLLRISLELPVRDVFRDWPRLGQSLMDSGMNPPTKGALRVEIGHQNAGVVIDNSFLKTNESGNFDAVAAGY